MKQVRTAGHKCITIVLSNIESSFTALLTHFKDIKSFHEKQKLTTKFYLNLAVSV